MKCRNQWEKTAQRSKHKAPSWGRICSNIQSLTSNHAWSPCTWTKLTIRCFLSSLLLAFCIAKTHVILRWSRVSDWHKQLMALYARYWVRNLQCRNANDSLCILEYIIFVLLIHLSFFHLTSYSNFMSRGTKGEGCELLG
jgi:hypothetical protein